MPITFPNPQQYGCVAARRILQPRNELPAVPRRAPKVLTGADNEERRVRGGFPYIVIGRVQEGIRVNRLVKMWT